MVRSRSIGAVCWCVLVLLAALDTATAQQQIPELDALRTPPTPAFAVLDLEPSAVERPATPSDAAVSLVSQFSDGAVPENFAFESSPYWLVSRPHLTWREDAQRTVGQSLARTTSVSVATAQTGTEPAPITSLAFGFRTLLFSGRLSAQTVKTFEDLEQRLAENGALFLRLMREQGFTTVENELLDCTMPRPSSPPPSKTKEECAADYDAKRKELADTVLQSEAFRRASAPLTGAGSAVPKREGFFLEVAGAFAWDFADADWEAQEFRKRAIWATPSYASGGWAALGVIRYEDAGSPDEDAVDWGGRLAYSTSNYAVSLEYVERSPVDSATLRRSHRLIGIGEYRVTSGTWIVASFGKDRQKTPTTDDTLVAQLGLSFNFSKERYRIPSATP